MAEWKVSADHLKAKAAADTAKAKLLKEQKGERGKASILNAFRKAVAQNRGFIFDDATNTIKIGSGANARTLEAGSPEFLEVEKRVNAMLEAYYKPGGNIVKAGKVLEKLTGKKLSGSQPTNTDPANIPSRPIPQAAINDLINNPSLARAFDEEYGDGKAAAILGDE